MRRVGWALCAGLVLFVACGGEDGAVGDVAGDETTAVVTSVATTTTQPATSAATTTAASTAPPTTQVTVTSPPTTQAVVVTTAAPATTKAKPTTTAPLVSFAEFSVSAPAACPAPDVSVQLEPPQVVVKWKLAGVIPDEVYVAVDNPDGAYQTGLPTQGEISLIYSCDQTQHTYYVVAVVGGQKFVKSKKV